MCLAQIEKIDGLAINIIIPIFLSAIYNQCLYYDDELFLLELLRSLIDIQLKNEINPRVVLQRSSCSFKIVFDAFLTASQSCKLCKCLHGRILRQVMISFSVLTAALHEPIMQLLIDVKRFSIRTFSRENLRIFSRMNVSMISIRRSP